MPENDLVDVYCYVRRYAKLISYREAVSSDLITVWDSKREHRFCKIDVFFLHLLFRLFIIFIITPVDLIICSCWRNLIWALKVGQVLKKYFDEFFLCLSVDLGVSVRVSYKSHCAVQYLIVVLWTQGFVHRGNSESERKYSTSLSKTQASILFTSACSKGQISPPWLMENALTLFWL